MVVFVLYGICVRDIEYLFKEIYLLIYIVNFCKYYKGKNLFVIVSRFFVNFFKKVFWIDLLFLVIFLMKSKNIIGWFNLICVDNSFILGNYV